MGTNPSWRGRALRASILACLIAPEAGCSRDEVVFGPDLGSPAAGGDAAIVHDSAMLMDAAVRDGSGPTASEDGPDAAAPLELALCAAGADPTATGDPPLADRVWSRQEAVRTFAREEYAGENGSFYRDEADARVALDAAGRAALVWSEYDGFLFHLWITRRDPNAGWQAPLQLDPPTPSGATAYDRLAGTNTYATYPGDALAANVVMAPDGTAFVTWEQTVGELGLHHGEIWISRVDAQGNATAPEPCPCGKQLALDADGGALSVWAQNGEIRANRYVPGVGWETPQTLGTSASGDPPAFALAPDGRGVVAFWDEAARALNVFSYARDTGFSPEPARAAGSGERLGPVSAGIDACGDALVLWQRNSVHGLEAAPAFLPDLWIATRTNRVWSEAIAFAAQDSESPALLVLPNSRALAFYQQSLGVPRVQVRASSTTWKPVDAPELGYGKVGMTSRGELLAIAVSEQGLALLGRRYTAEGDASSVGPDSIGQGWLEDLAMNVHGRAVVIFDSANDLSAAWLE